LENRLIRLFTIRIIVVHDHNNELAARGTNEEVKFKLASLTDIFKRHDLERVDLEWNPRA
jgi:hypothetical protein